MSTAAIRRHVEKLIARVLIRDAVQAGYEIDVYDGEEFSLRGSTDRKAILAAMFSTDQDRLDLVKNGLRVGWVLFVYGNSGWDVISNYSTNLEPLMANASALANRFS